MTEDYKTVARILQYLDKNFKEQPELEEIARQVNLSPSHIQKVFSRWVGISPKKFIQYLTIDYAKKMLGESRSVLDTPSIFLA